METNLKEMIIYLNREKELVENLTPDDSYNFMLVYMKAKGLELPEDLLEELNGIGPNYHNDTESLKNTIKADGVEFIKDLIIEDIKYAYDFSDIESTFTKFEYPEDAIFSDYLDDFPIWEDTLSDWIICLETMCDIIREYNDKQITCPKYLIKGFIQIDGNAPEFHTLEADTGAECEIKSDYLKKLPGIQTVVVFGITEDTRLDWNPLMEKEIVKVPFESEPEPEEEAVIA